MQRHESVHDRSVRCGQMSASCDVQRHHRDLLRQRGRELGHVCVFLLLREGLRRSATVHERLVRGWRLRA